MIKEYFKKEAISNSLLQRVGFFFQEQMIDRFSFDEEPKETLSLFIGSQIHKAMETNGGSIANLKILDTDCFEELTDSEVKILKSENPDEEYYNVYNNATTRLAKEAKGKETLSAKEANALTKVEDHITQILFKGSPYLNSKLGITDEDIVLNEYKLIDGEKESYIPDPEGVKATIENCYNAIIRSSEHEAIVERDLFEECVEHFELEYYGEMFGYRVKGMFDRVIVLPEQKRAVLIDYKTHHGKTTIEKSILKYNYCHSLSWYLKLFNLWLREQGYMDFTVDTYIVGISTESYKVSVVALSEKALQCGQYGGYMKPQLYTIYNNDDEFDPFLSEADVEWLKHNNIWSSTKNNHFKRLGWNENFNIGIEADIFEKYKI